MAPRPPLSPFLHWTLLLMRISIGATFIAHGMMKWQNFDAPAQTTMAVIMKVLAVVEPVAGMMMILGIGAEFAGVALIVIMLGAIANKISGGGLFVGKGAWEFDFALLCANVVLLATGPGTYSLDAMWPAHEKHWWQFWRK